MVPTQEKNFPTQSTIDGVVVFLLLLITGVLLKLTFYHNLTPPALHQIQMGKLWF
jgi:hypothetical protein